MRTLEDRFYSVTIPEYGGHPLMPKPVVVTLAATIEWDWHRGEVVVAIDGGRAFRDVVVREPIPLRLVAAKRAELRAGVERRCAGMRRRQGRVRR